MPRVSIVLPVWNGDGYIRQAVESIGRQTLSDFELLVVDDGSVDSTPAILSELAAVDPRIRVISRPHLGLVNALNVGFGNCRSEFVARMDADDIALPIRLETQVRALENDPRLGVVGSAITLVSKELRPQHTIHYPLTDREIRAALPSGSPFAHPAVIVRKSAFERAGGYRSAFIHAEDYDLWLRMADVATLANVPEVLLYYRIHADQVSMTQAKQQVVSVVSAQIASWPGQTSDTGKLADLAPLTPDTFSIERYLDRKRIAERLTSAAASIAVQMILLGNDDGAANLIQWACASARLSRLPRGVAARLNLAHATAYWSRRKLWPAVRAAATALGGAPLTTTALAWRAACRGVATGRTQTRRRGASYPEAPCVSRA